MYKFIVLFSLLANSVSSFARSCENIHPAKKIMTEIGQKNGMTRSTEVKVDYENIVCHEDGGISFLNLSIMLNDHKLKLVSTSAADFCSLYEMLEKDRLEDDYFFPRTLAILNNQGAGRNIPSKVRMEKQWSSSQLINVTCRPVKQRDAVDMVIKGFSEDDSSLKNGSDEILDQSRNTIKDTTQIINNSAPTDASSGISK